MKFFVTGRSTNYEKVKQTFDLIEQMGHSITLRWTDFPSIKPYNENDAKAAEFSVQQIEGIKMTDIFVIFSHNDGTGVFTEFGAALALAQLRGTPKIYAIGDGVVRSACMFHYHPLIIWKESFAEVLDDVQS